VVSTVCLSPLHVVGSVQCQPPIWWCHQLVAHPLETVRLPWQVQERGTVYRHLRSTSTSFTTFKNNLNHFCLDCHSVCDNVYRSLTMFSALAAVCTVDCAIEIVLITLHYITLHSRPVIPNSSVDVSQICGSDEEYNCISISFLSSGTRSLPA